MKNTTKPYKYILFDWDGTLVKTLDIWLNLYKELIKKYNVEASNLTDLEVVEKAFGKWAKGFENLGFTNPQEACDEAWALVDERVNNVDVYPNVKQVLDKLKESNKKLTLHTSSDSNMLYPAILNNDLEKYFEIILTKDDVKKGKPDPEVILKEMTFLNAKPEECLIVGDSEGDIKTGKNADVDTVLFYPESHKRFYREEFLMKESPTYVIHDLLELLEVVN